MRLLIITSLLLLSVFTYGQERKEKERERTNSSLDSKDMHSENENSTVVSYGELPEAVKNKLQELNIGEQAIESIKEKKKDEKTVYAVKFYQKNELETLYIKENGEIKNK